MNADEVPGVRGAWRLPEGTIISQGGVFVTVHYPYRKGPDLYLAMIDYPVHCCNCDQDVPLSLDDEMIIGHIRMHDRRASTRRLAAVEVAMRSMLV